MIVGIMPIIVASSAALAVGYGLGEQAPLGEQPAQTVTQEVRRTGDVKRLCLTVKPAGVSTRSPVRCSRHDGRPHMSERIRLTTAMRELLLEIWQNGSAYPLDRNHQRTFEALEVRDCIEHVTWGRWQITPLGETIAKRLTERNLE